ncbi:YgaP family membrane protein [Pseudomonas phoenicis]|uniref:YgaP family membrane protein n=1 Tax=unclassified Pseudomonas TaxID=196821 RepID=UPI0039A13DE6
MSDNHSNEKNVKGIERFASLAGGVVMIGRGLSKGGFVGLVHVAVGGLALARGVKGHCAAKSFFEEHRSEYDRLRSGLEHDGAELAKLKASADAATRGVSVTGKDPITG